MTASRSCSTGASSSAGHTVYEALRAGASGFLLKNAPAEELVQAIRVVVAIGVSRTGASGHAGIVHSRG